MYKFFRYIAECRMGMSVTSRRFRTDASAAILENKCTDSSEGGFDVLNNIFIL